MPTATFLPPPALKPHASGGYFVDQKNVPFLMTGSCAWTLFTQPSLADAKLLIDSRSAAGFNALLVMMLDNSFANTAPSNQSSVAPFSTPGDFSTPNAAYWANVDAVCDYAYSKGIVLYVAPMYLGFNGGAEGVESQVAAQTNVQIQAYGAFIGNRYKGRPGIVWVMSGDRDPGASVKQKVTDFVTGLQSTGDQHPVAAHGTRNSSSRSIYSTVNWLTWNAVYTDSSPAATAAAAYALTPFMPCFLIEDYYVNEHSITALGVRNEGWWAVLSGCTSGQMFGENNCQFQGATSADGFADVTGRDWKTQLTSASAADRARIGTCLRARAFHLLVPDAAHTVVTAGFSSGANLVTTARASDGSCIVAYCPTGSTVTITVDMSKITGANALCQWFNPRAGGYTNIGTFSPSGTRNFTPPDGNDWVLTVDAA